MLRLGSNSSQVAPPVTISIVQSQHCNDSNTGWQPHLAVAFYQCATYNTIKAYNQRDCCYLIITWTSLSKGLLCCFF
ncbi:Hypothetical predicted protein [Podarcis lilfordi]|uniref:Uncharacterized protein n=1 Tax=Podarcis lilfordi TaxID=74358 RepID=A0AA35KEX3_9SAUR|nr:Hypothetical predicted protein [Podarcis lilfordi]